MDERLVGAAEAGVVDLDEDLVGAAFGDRDFFDDDGGFGAGALLDGGFLGLWDGHGGSISLAYIKIQKTAMRSYRS